MPIVDGTPVDAATTNPTFIYKDTNDTSSGILTLESNLIVEGDIVIYNNIKNGDDDLGVIGADRSLRKDDGSTILNFSGPDLSGDGIAKITDIANPTDPQDVATKDYVDSAVGVASPLTTKGDLYTFDTDNQRLAVGTDGQLLSSDSTQATGLKWTTVSSSATDTTARLMALLF